MRRAFGSVRARAALAASLVVAVALVTAGVAVLLSLRSNLTAEAGVEAERSARAIASELAVRKPARTPYEELGGLDGEDEPVQITDSRGRLVAASENLERITGTPVSEVRPRPSASPGGRDGDGTQPPRDDGTDTDSDSETGTDDDAEEGGDDADDEAGDDSGEPGTIAPAAPDESLAPGEMSAETTFGNGSATVEGVRADYRFAAVDVQTHDRGRLTVYAGAPLAAEHSAVDTARAVMLVGLPLLLAVVGSVTWLVTGRALRPVEGIRKEMAAITASEDLGRRVPVPATHDEVARLARTTNETLTALEASVERQRSFVADASHELRSPIASLRTQLEVAAAHPELLDLDGVVEDIVRLQHLAADLLLLARLDAGERPVSGRVDLAVLAQEESRGRESVQLSAEPLEVNGSRVQLGRVVANLLDNAERHARSRVTVTVRRDGSAAVLEVADDGGGLAEADRERVFERFVRLDDARSRDEGGAGLGLAIARDLAVRHRGTLTAGPAPTGGALFSLRLPLAEGELPDGGGQERGGE